MSVIAAISTPNAAGAIGIVRLSGDGAIEIASSCFRTVSGTPLSEHKGYTAAYGTVFDDEGDFDDAVILVFRAPKSYTGEDIAEICCHGGLLILQRTLRAVFSKGALPAEAGEFTKRAFLNGKMDLSQAEAVMNVISAQGDAALTAARNTLKGSISAKISDIASSLVSEAASLSAWADYPEEDIPAVKIDSLENALENSSATLDALIRRYDSGRAVTEGVFTVICGRPNVGKSTLMNLLSGTSRSIVTPVAGTTRDVIEETVRLGDLLLRLADTAGLRETDDEIESIGVNLARDKINSAQLILAVLDASRPLSEEDTALLSNCSGKKAVVIINKSDLVCSFSAEDISGFNLPVVTVSATSPDTPEVIKQAIEKVLGTADFDPSGQLLANERQRQCCLEARCALSEGLSALRSGITLDAVSVSIDSALNSLFTLTGQRAGEEVVNEVFRKFCVGK